MNQKDDIVISALCPLLSRINSLGILTRLYTNIFCFSRHLLYGLDRRYRRRNDKSTLRIKFVLRGETLCHKIISFLAQNARDVSSLYAKAHPEKFT